MIGWLWRKFVGRFDACAHKWSEQDRWQLIAAEDKRWVGVVIIQRCDHCGKLNRFSA